MTETSPHTPPSKIMPAGLGEPTVPEPRASQENRPGAPETEKVNSRPRRRVGRLLAALVGVLAIFGAGIGAALWFTADSGTPLASTQAAAPTTPSYTPTAGKTPQEQNFLVAWHTANPSVANAYEDWWWLDFGKRVCGFIGTPGVTRVNYPEGIAGNPSIKDSSTGTTFLEKSHNELCPERTFANELTYAAPFYSTPSYSTPSAPVSVPGQFTSGTYEVGGGAGEIAPGKYVAAAGSSRCYFARLRNLDGGVGSIIDNKGEYSGGQVILNVNRSDKAVEISGDCTFVKR